MNVLLNVAKEFAGSFEERQRNNGDKFICVRDGAPDWVKDIVQAAHDDFFPDDWRYRLISRVADDVSERLDYCNESELDDARGEIVDGLVPIYNGERMAWLSSHLQRANYCDQARGDGLIASDAGIFEQIGCGIYQEIDEIFGYVWQGLTDRAEEIGEECATCAASVETRAAPCDECGHMDGEA